MPELEILKTKPVRFAKVVQAAGKPQPYTLWTEPARDPEFQKAIREQRLVTVLRQKSKSDTAVVGFLKKPSASYLVFPNGLGQFAERRIVGLKYNLLAEAKPRGKLIKLGARKPGGRLTPPPRLRAVPPTPEQTHQATDRRRPEPPVKAPTRFRVQARVITTMDREVEVEANNQREARATALTILKQQSSDAGGGKTDIRIRKVAKER